MQKTDLNVSPYYDDFENTDDFHRVLFRPGFAVQARELTQLQSILQNQIEKFGTHMFKEGAMVIPGQSGFTNEYYAVKLQSTFDSNPVSAYAANYVGQTITGATSGVKASVVGFELATTTDPLTLYVKYVATGTDNVSTTFSNNENIQSSGVVGGKVANSSSATLQASSATATGSSANVEEGVYFVRGQFVRVASQRIVLDKYTNTPSYRIGLSISETLITPETDTSLLDNAQGSSNINAKGAHRLKVTLTLAKLPIGSAEDEDFVEILRVKNGIIQEKTRNTEYSVLGETLARRTFDESGDYSVRPFGVDIRESLDDGLNEGVYASGINTDQGASSSEGLMAVQVSPGKAYVRGYEIETAAPTFIDVSKPRTTEEFKGAITPAEVGNFTKVTKVYGTPDLSPFVSGEITDPYKKISLRDTATATRGQAAGNEIGVARARAFEHRSGTDATSDALVSSGSGTGLTSQFNLYLFDIRMITKLTMSGTPSAGTTVGAKVTGATSGASGFIHFASSTSIELINVVGSFNTGEKLSTTSSAEADEILENSSNADLTIAAVVINTFDKVKQVFMDDSDSGQDFSADTVLGTSFSLSGTVSTAGSGTTVSGFGTKFVTELRAGDVINISGVGDRIVNTITDDDTLAVTVAPGVAQTTVPATRKRVNLQDQSKNLLLRKLRKNHIKTLKTDSNSNASVTAVTFRRQFVVNSTNSGQLIVNAEANETFSANSNTDFVVSVLANSGSGAAAGDLINLNSSNTSFSATGNSLTITNTNAFPAANIKCKLVATVTRTASNQIPKTAQLASVCVVDNDGVAGAAAYGTSAHHKDISLGVADAYKLWAVFDSEDSTADATIPQFTFTGLSGVFTKGEVIVGATTGARAVVIPGSSVLTYVTQNNRDFQSGEKVTGQESNAFATIDVMTDGSKNITERYVLDTGQRDNFYDIARIVRKGSAVSPTGRLTVVYNYFEHGAGDFFTVDSYGVDYKEIPTYTATRVDPEVREPSGEFDLRNSIDFRPRVADATMTSATSGQGIATKKVTSMSFNFGSRSFTGTGGHTVLIPKDNSNIAYDFEFFLGRVDVLFLTQKGDFKISTGTPAEAPELPKTLENAMKIAEFTFPAYMLDIDDARMSKEDNRRYTMRDIGKLEQRIENVEYYTALNLLEQEAQSLEILDANGLNRFKSGFLVDNFKGHSTGDVQHPDYRNSMDMEEGELRPQHKMKGITLSEENTTDAQRTNDNYQKTGEMITLPYSNVVVAQNSYASRVENLNPVLNFTWTGICKLSPSGDEWFETERTPALIINREGNFNTILAQNRNAIGTVWNAWQTQWSGTSTSSRTFRDHSFTSAASRSVPGRAVISRTTTTTTSRQSRSGINTRVVPRIDRESQGDRVVSRALIPFIRARNVTFNVTGMKPLMRVYPFFDKQNVTQYVTPSGGSLGGNLVSTASGAVSGVFAIPNPNTRGNPRFRTGERVFRLTTSSTNSTDPEPESFAQASYSATGILTTLQETIIATRNADVIRTSVTDNRTTTDTSTRDEVTGWWDPLAQSVMPQADGGEYLTKVDVFFSQKDENIPVTCQIRTMNTGYPTTKVLPFASKTLTPAEVSVSSTGATPTTFIFDSPVYVKNGVEVAIVLQTDSDKYLTWISRMGEKDVGGNRMISEQPYLGVLFKSQNNSTWTAYDFEDLKFTLYRASFSTNVNGKITLINDTLPVASLEKDPLQFFSSATASLNQKVKVTHRDHHMYDTDSNVIIAGAKSGISTTLATVGGINASANALALTSVSLFPTSAKTGTIHLKIGDEIMTGTITSTNVASITRGADNTTAAVHAQGATVELYQINNVPLTEINKTHTTISNIGIDSYVIALSTASDTDSTSGGASITATENAMLDGLQTLVPTIEHPDTSVTAEIRATTGTSPSGSQSSYSTAALTAQNAEKITIGENFFFSNPKLVASQINETNELAGSKSMFLDFTMSTTKENLSPVIDLDRRSIVAFTNRLNNVDSSSSVFPTTDYISPEEPDGDSNEAVYCTKRVTLQNPATSIKVLHSAVRFSGAEIQIMYKILRSDDASDFDEIGWRYFNSTGGPDISVNESTTADDFIEYEYTQDSLEEFIAFAIKIRMQGINSSEPPRIKDLRAIALAT
tara:strand:- start:939 stop:7322 length:6384 start_codon:yes stop_codon:yes gene_type:complete